jgi:hypothetical protein
MRPTLNVLEFHHQRLADVAHYLTSSRDWDALFIETHASDYASHFFLGQAEAFSGADPDTVVRCLSGVRRTYQSSDRMMGRVVELAGDDTLVVVVSDHGGSPNQFQAVHIEDVLEQAGFLVYQDSANGQREVDWSRTRAANVGLVHIFINLQGRDPTGIVAPEAYEETQRGLIAALHAYKDPVSGRHLFALALTRANAERVNLWGDLVGDVVYAKARTRRRPWQAVAHRKTGYRRATLYLCHRWRGHSPDRAIKAPGPRRRCRADDCLSTGYTRSP